MRFKKVISAGGAFLLLVGASTLGAAAAYADDAVPAPETAVVEPVAEPVAEPVVEPAPTPAPEPAPVVEPAAEPAPEPVVEPAPEPVTEPAPAPAPSTETDSDPPAVVTESVTEETTEAPVAARIAPSSFETKVGFTLAAGKDKDEEEDVPQTCKDLTDSSWEDKVDTVGDPATVPYTAPDGFLIAAYCVKAGNEQSGGGAYIEWFNPPVESVVIDHEDVNSVSHYQVLLVPIEEDCEDTRTAGFSILTFDEECPDIEVTPAAEGTDQTCDDEELVGGSIQLTLIDGVTYTITGPDGVVAYDGSGLAEGLDAGEYEVTWVLDDGYATDVESPIVITIGVFDEDCGVLEDVEVNPAADGADQTCEEEGDAEELVGGSIQLTLIDGVTYTITGPNGVVAYDGSGLAEGLDPGEYEVTWVLDDGYTTDVVSPIVITIAAPEIDCVEEDDDKVTICHATQANEQAENEYNVLTISVQAAYNGHVKLLNENDDHNNDVIPPFWYKVQGVLTFFEGYNYGPGAAEFIANGCADPEEVTPAASATDQTCFFGVLLIDGDIQLTLIEGVTYTITGPEGEVEYDDTGLAEGLDPGEYEVSFVLADGLTTDVESPILLSIGVYDGECDFTTFPLVTPEVSSTPLTCLSNGSYTLDNDLDDPAAISWTVNGSPVDPGTYAVTTPGSFDIVATANGPEYGFEDDEDGIIEFPLTFTSSAATCDLATLALTGQSPIAFLGGAMVLILAGLAMFRLRTATRRARPTAI